MTVVEKDRAKSTVRAPVTSMLVVSGAMAVHPTAATDVPQYLNRLYEWSAHSTATGSVQRQTTESTRRAITELRRISGLTWDQLARMFGVNRRSIHFWASGKALSVQHEAHLRRALDVIRRTDRGSAQLNRAALLQPGEGGTPLELLAGARFVSAEEALGRSRAARREQPRARLDEKARAARRPPPPDELVGAEDDVAHREPTVRRRTKASKRKG